MIINSCFIIIKELAHKSVVSQVIDELVLSDRINACEMDVETRDWFLSYAGKQISLPDKFMPSKEFIHYHNDVIFMR